MTSKRKSGFVDRMVEKFPEMHIWGYKYCGPNTNLESRLAHDEPGINELDRACKEHDIAYSESNERDFRYNADKLLVLRAIRRVYAKDSRIGERFAASLVSMLVSIKMFLSKIEIYINDVRKWCIVSKTKKK